MCAWAEHGYGIIHVCCTEMSEASYGTAKEFISDLNEGLMAGGTMVLNDGECFKILVYNICNLRILESFQ